MNPLLARLGQRLGAFGTDDRPVRREVSAHITFFPERLHDAQDVLAHEDFAAGHADLQAFLIRKRALQRFERHLLPPLALDVEQVAHVAELALQIAAHRRFVHDAGGQSSGVPVLFLDELFDSVLVPMFSILRQQARYGR
jgi:hypothetical protein